MADTMRENNGVGLAAPQGGFTRVIIDVGNGLMEHDLRLPVGRRDLR